MAVLGKGPPYVNRQCYFMHIFEHLLYMNLIIENV